MTTAAWVGYITTKFITCNQNIAPNPLFTTAGSLLAPWHGPALLAERYGVAAYASISGTLALALALAGALAPVGAGALRTGFGSYPPVFGLLALIAFVAAGVVFIAMRAP